MSNVIAIKSIKLTKEFLLFSSPKNSFLYNFGLKFLIKGKSKIPKHCPLQDISFEIKKGERVAILGKNGAGKSTLLKIIAGFMYPTSGEIKVAGKISSLFSIDSGITEELTGLENIKKSAVMNGVRLKNLSEYEEDIIGFSELEDVINQPVYTYSLGMKMRLQFAIATAITPDILIIDEVLGAGDAYFASKSYERVENLVKSDCTLVIVSHSAQTIEKLCTRALLIHDGKILKDDRPDKVIPLYLSISRTTENTCSYKIGDWVEIPKSNRPYFLESRINSLEKPDITCQYQEYMMGNRQIKVYSKDNKKSVVGFESHFKSKHTNILYAGDSLSLKVKLAQKLRPNRELIHIRIYDSSSKCVGSFERSLNDCPNKDTIELVLYPLILGSGDYQVSVRLESKGKNLVELYPNIFTFLVNYANDADPPLYHLPGEWDFGQGVTSPARISPHQ